MRSDADLSSARLVGLDSVRGLAIVLVVMFHFFHDRVFHGWLNVIVGPFGLAGVTLFFMLSGFLIERHLARDPNLVRYFSRRIFRIFPAYLVAISLTLAIEYWRSGSIPWSVNELFANAIMAQDILGAPLMLGVLWTLLVEVKFYTLAPFVKRAPTVIFRIAPYAAIVSNAGVLFVRGEASNLLTYMTFCLVGMQFGPWTRGEMSTPALAALIAAAAASAYAFTIYFPIGLAIFVVFNSVVLALALKHPVDWPPLPFIGRVSYSWYLYHAAIGYSVIAAATSLLPAKQDTAIVGAFVGIFVSLAVSWVSFVLIERPGIALGHRCEKLLAPRASKSGVTNVSPCSSG